MSFLRRLLGRPQDRRSGPPRGRFGLFGPFPYYATRTRGGASVRVGGCCLPVVAAMAALPLLAARRLWRRR